MGDWIDDMWGPVKELKDKLHEDKWLATEDHWLAAGKALLDIHYKNAEHCHFQRLSDDFFNWCFENEAACFRWGGFFGRIAENFMELLHNDMDMFRIIKQNDMCYTDD